MFVKSIALVLLLASTTLAAPQIEQKDLFLNTDSSCVWLSLTTLCRHNKVTRGYNIYPSHKGGANEKHVIKALKDRQINFCIQWKGNKDTKLLQWACQQGYYCAVGRKQHCFILVHYSDKEVWIIDNRKEKAGKLQRWSREDFHKVWTGLVYVILP